MYLDNIIMIGKMFYRHYKNLEEVMSRKKCHLFQTKVTYYLGHIASKNGIGVDKVQTIQQLSQL